MSDMKVPQVPWFEVLYYMDHDGIIEDVFTEDFCTKEKALAYYEEHKNDHNKYGWLVTKRADKLEPIEIYVGSVNYFGDK